MKRNRLKEKMLVLSLMIWPYFAFADAESYLQNHNELNIKSMLDEMSFKFRPQFMFDDTGDAHLVHAEHHLYVGNDLLIAHLPYVAKPNDLAPFIDKRDIRIDSRDFNYSYRQNEDGWDISIRPKGGFGHLSMFLYIRGGSVELVINELDKLKVSYQGTLAN